jgi:hypothetical protein
MEERGSAGGSEREVAEFVGDDEIGGGEAPRDLSWVSLKLFLFEGVDEFDGGEKPDGLAVSLGLSPDEASPLRP